MEDEIMDFETRNAIAVQTVLDYEKEEGIDIDTAMDRGTFDASTVTRLIREGVARAVRYLETS